MSDENENTEVRGGEYQPKLTDAAQNFLDDLRKEKSRLGEDFPLCALLIDEAFDRIYSTGRIPGREFHADVLKQRPMKLTQKVFVPIRQYPKFNFIGKILGPKGNSLTRLQEETQCKILIKGRNSMRDKAREEELRNSDDPRYSHLHKDLYLEIFTKATPAECYARIAYSLAELRKYLIPDKNDEVSHEQLREIMEIDPGLAKASYGSNPKMYKSVFDAKGSAKYLSILRAAKADKMEENEFEYEHVSHSPPQGPIKRLHGYEYIKVPSSSNEYKRTAAPSYAEHKRIRDVSSSKHYNSNITTSPHLRGILNKYK